MKWLLAIAVLLATAGAARAQALEVHTSWGVGPFRAAGHFAGKDGWRGGLAMEMAGEVRSHDWAIVAGGGPHWGHDVTLLGWHVDLARYLELARHVGHGHVVMLDTFARIGIADSSVLVDPQRDGLDLGGWCASTGLDLRIAFHAHPGDVAYIWSVTLDVRRISFDLADGVRVPSTTVDAAMLRLGLIAGGR